MRLPRSKPFGSSRPKPSDHLRLATSPTISSPNFPSTSRSDGRRAVSIGDTANFGFFDKFTLSAWIRTDETSGTIVSRMTDVPEGDGYQLALAGGKLQLNLVKRWLDDATRVETVEPLAPGPWHHVAATYDGSREASGIKLYVDGVPQKLNVLLDELNQTFAVKQPLRIGGGGGPGGLFRGQIDDVRIYRHDLSPEDIAVLATRRSIRDILAWPRDRRLPAERAKLRACFLAKGASPEVAATRSSLHRRCQPRTAGVLAKACPTTMVMEEMPEPRPTHVLIRGQYDQPANASRRACSKHSRHGRMARRSIDWDWRSGSSIRPIR